VAFSNLKIQHFRGAAVDAPLEVVSGGTSVENSPTWKDTPVIAVLVSDGQDVIGLQGLVERDKAYLRVIIEIVVFNFRAYTISKSCTWVSPTS
jgi:hypothetical protein